MSHKIKIDDFLDFDHESIIASSSEGKRLIISTHLNVSGEAVSFFIVSKRNDIIDTTKRDIHNRPIILQKGVYVQQSRHLLLNEAVEAYNSI
jgi:hypothetical protein